MLGHLDTARQVSMLERHPYDMHTTRSCPLLEDQEDACLQATCMRGALVCMQVESTILAGPHSNLTAFLKSLARLEASTAFLAQHRWAYPCDTSCFTPA